MVESMVEMVDKTLNLKNPETCRLADRVARMTGESKTQAVKVALRERLARLESPAGEGSLAEQIMAIGKDCASRLSPRTKRMDHGEYLYDEKGLPR
jgi:antitoxin VapB